MIACYLRVEIAYTTTATNAFSLLRRRFLVQQTSFNLPFQTDTACRAEMCPSADVIVPKTCGGDYDKYKYNDEVVLATYVDTLGIKAKCSGRLNETTR